MAVLYTSHFVQFFDNAGAPLSGGKLYSFAAGTTTPKATFTTAAGDIENTNPVILDAYGRAVVFIDGAYKFTLTDSADVPIRTVDNITNFTTLDSASDPFFETLSGNGTQTAFTLGADLGTEEKAIFVWVDSGLQEHVTNGTFATDTGWTKGTGWTIGSGVATASGAISTAIEQTSAVTLLAGQSYTVTFTITVSAGTLTASIGGRAGTARSGAGTFTETIIAGSTQVIAFTGAGFTGTLDSVTVAPAVSNGRQIQPPTSYTINGTSLTFTTAPASGTNNIFVSAPLLSVGAATTAAAAAQAAEASALAAQAAAETAAANLRGTSATSLLIGTGSKVFTTQSGKQFNVGNFILAVSDADEANFMHGQVTAYSGTSLTIDVTATGGSGTFADWSLYISGARGAVGATGTIDDLSGVPTGTVALADDFFVFQDVNDANLTKRTKLGTAAGAPLIDDDTMATATATNVPSAESVKAYVDTAAVKPALKYSYELSSGSAGPTYTTGAWRTVLLNTEVVDTAGIGSLSSNEITLPAGTYFYQGYVNMATGSASANRKRLYNVTDAAVLDTGANTNGVNVALPDAFSGVFTLSGSKAIRFEVRTTVNTAAGTALSLGDNEIYNFLTIIKLA